MLENTWFIVGEGRFACFDNYPTLDLVIIHSPKIIIILSADIVIIIPLSPQPLLPLD